MNIAAIRLQNQKIANNHCNSPEEVVRWMGAMQAQDYGQAVWAVGLRTKNPTLTAVQKAIEDRKILLTWPMRGTIHFVPAEDAKWMVQTFAARKIASYNQLQKQLGIDEAMQNKAERLLIANLKGGKRLSRLQIMQLFEDAAIATQNQRGYHLIVHFAHTGLICQGPLEGKQQTFVLLDEWVPDSKLLTREIALGELAKRYFTSHGPASIKDFANWANLTLTEAKFGLEATVRELTSIEVNGDRLWLSKEAATYTKPPQSLHLLPGFDEYLLGYKDRGDILAAHHASKIVPGNNGVFRPMIVVDGQVSGTWRRSLKKNAIDFDFDLFEGRVPQSTLREAALRYAKFMNLSLGAITVTE